MAGPFSSACWPAGQSQWSGEQHPSHHATSLPLHNGQPRADRRRQLQPAIGMPSLSSALGNYASPSRAEQGALSVLKDYPDHLLAQWFESARQGRSGKSFSVFICMTDDCQTRPTLSRRLACPYCIPPLHQRRCNRSMSLGSLQTPGHIMSLLPP